MKVPVGTVVDEMTRLLAEAVGSLPPKNFDPTWILRNVVMAANHVHPILPNSWFTPEDSDVYINLQYTLARTVTNPAILDEVVQALPTDMLRLRGINILLANSRADLEFDYSRFAQKKSNMGSEPVVGLNHYIFYQSGQNIHYFPASLVDIPTRLQYVKRVVHPNTSGSVGYVVLAERAIPLVYAYAASKGKWGDSAPQEAAALSAMWERELTTSMLLQAQQEPKDPFLLNAHRSEG